MLRDPENYDYEFVKTEIESITDKRDKALICFLYASAGRVSEANRVCSKDITTQTINNIEYLIIRIVTLKKRNATDVYRQVPIRLDESWLAKPILDYASVCQSRLFPLHRATIYRKCMSNTGFNPHGFRKLRLTHLAQKYKFTDQQLVKFAGWADSRPASIYAKMNLEDIAY